ncbi:MAG: hypothetical protein GY866_40270 [Proteobacteria bacterium]|nr:hypothetical protein [Pseudomonadota bacterium]
MPNPIWKAARLRFGTKEVVALTAFAMKGNQEKFLDAYLSKPIHLTHLMEKILFILN